MLTRQSIGKILILQPDHDRSTRERNNGLETSCINVMPASNAIFKP